jgi:membrane fusion protein
MDDKPLFRIESMAEQRLGLSGEVIIVKSVSATVWVWVLVVTFAVVVGFLWNAQFSRKETVVGYITPDAGAIKVRSRTVGRIEQMHFALGDRVEKGDILFSIETDIVGSAGASVYDELLKEISVNIGKHQQRLVELKNEAEEIISATERRVAAEHEAVENLSAVLAIRKTRTKASEEKIEAVKGLVNSGYLPQFALLEMQDELLALREAVIGAEQEIREKRAGIAALLSDIEISHARYAQQQLDAEDGLSRLRQQEIEQKLRKGVQIPAPISGWIVSAHAELGDIVTQDHVIAVVVPTQAQLIARLLVPSSAAGFVEPGDQVRLMLDSFPFQRFGTQAGVVSSVSGSITLPGEVHGPVQVNQAVFSVDVALEGQSILARGRQRPLQPGMTLKADIVLEKQKVFDWIFDPLLSLKGRI